MGLELPRATVGMSRWRRFRAAVDWPLIVTMLALCAIGLLNLYSATRGVRHHHKFDTQVQWMIVGAVGFLIVTVIDYRAIVRLAWIGLGIAFAALVLARLTGRPASSDTHGVTYRWLNIGGMGIQPSELVKLM
ncbi:MAG TPA: FtsW/RodA/SpoVE family cell cycle protein, partial [Kofleriaceae bacterium]